MKDCYDYFYWDSCVKNLSQPFLKYWFYAPVAAWADVHQKVSATTEKKVEQAPLTDATATEDPSHGDNHLTVLTRVSISSSILSTSFSCMLRRWPQLSLKDRVA